MAMMVVPTSLQALDSRVERLDECRRFQRQKPCPPDLLHHLGLDNLRAEEITGRLRCSEALFRPLACYCILWPNLTPWSFARLAALAGTLVSNPDLANSSVIR